jgi:hypothetical protein
VRELAVDAPPGIPKVREFAVDALPGITEVRELAGIVQGRARCLVRPNTSTPPAAYPVAAAPNPPARYLGAVKIGVFQLPAQAIGAID